MLLLLTVGHDESVSDRKSRLDFHHRVNISRLRWSLMAKSTDVLKCHISLLIKHTCIAAKKIDFETGHFRNFRTFATLTFTLDLVIRYTVDLYLQTKFC